MVNKTLSEPYWGLPEFRILSAASRVNPTCGVKPGNPSSSPNLFLRNGWKPGSSPGMTGGAVGNDKRAAASARPNEADRLVALEQIEQVAQRLPARRGERRIAREDERGVVARRPDQLAVHLDARELEPGQAGLAGAEHVAFAAQPEVFLGDAEPVLALAHDGEPRLGGVAERRLVEQQAGRMLGAAPDAAAQLMELGEPEPLGVLDHHHRRLRHVDADLDHGGGDKE